MLCDDYSIYDINSNVLSYQCRCGYLRTTPVNITVNYGGLSSHGIYSFNGTRDQVIVDYPTCTEEYNVLIHL